MTDQAQNYICFLNDLKSRSCISREKLTLDPPDDFLASNPNFFTKSYLIMMCVYFEAYIKEIASTYINHINAKLNIVKLPRNLLVWNLKSNEKLKNNDQKFEDYKLKISKEDIDRLVSANPYRMLELFSHLGIDLSSNEEINKDKDIINSIVTKRNNVIHYNDSASDVSFDDIITYVEAIDKYIRAIDGELENYLK